MPANDDNDKPMVGAYIGDAGGIGPELIAKIAADGFLDSLFRTILVCDRRILDRGMRQAGVSFDYRVIDSPAQADFSTGLQVIDRKNVDPSEAPVGQVSAVAGRATGDAFLTLLDFHRQGLIKGFFYASINKAALKAGGFEYESEQEMFADKLGLDSPRCEVNVLGDFMTSRVTSHIPIKDVASSLSTDSILRSIELLHATMARSGVAKPRLAVAALNPHCGENGTCGREEMDVIAPAVEKARAKGIDANGPLSADVLFFRAFKGDYDAAVTMYHDQGQIALKLKGFESGVTVHGGIPIPITTPSHGSAYDIAGKNLANPQAMRNAVRLLAKMTAN